MKMDPRGPETVALLGGLGVGVVSDPQARPSVLFLLSANPIVETSSPFPAPCLLIYHDDHELKLLTVSQPQLMLSFIRVAMK